MHRESRAVHRKPRAALGSVVLAFQGDQRAALVDQARLGLPLAASARRKAFAWAENREWNKRYRAMSPLFGAEMETGAAWHSFAGRER